MWLNSKFSAEHCDILFIEKFIKFGEKSFTKKKGENFSESTKISIKKITKIKGITKIGDNFVEN